ncbi:MAG TPA: hypothetical protein VKZ45_02775, partial [Vicingaceae bacterium]|nr:hypothetical protein [Vicingaceae bacterium]
DAKNYIKIFTLKPKEEIESLIKQHEEAPHLRVLQKALAEDITVRVHSQEDYDAAVNASEILFKTGEEAVEGLKKLPENLFNAVFEGVPQTEISKGQFNSGIPIIDLLASQTNFLASNGEARRALKENSISVNKSKVDENTVVDASFLINNNYLLLQRGKKNYFVVKVK